MKRNPIPTERQARNALARVLAGGNERKAALLLRLPLLRVALEGSFALRTA